MNDFKTLDNDLKISYKFPKDLKDLAKIKCDLNHGQRVAWYYKDEEKFWKEEQVEPRKYTSWSGLILGKPGLETSGHNLDYTDCVLVIDSEPCEKCYPEIQYCSLAQFVDNEDLVEIYNEK